MKYGILGGTFDPPHLGHLGLARAAIAELELDEVLFVPAYQNPLKRAAPVAPPNARLGMVEALVAREPKMAVSDLELRRREPSYAVDTLEALIAVRPGEYWLLLGADAMRSLDQWRRVKHLLRLCRLAVALRPPLTSFDVTVRLAPEEAERVDLLSLPPIDVSATELRKRLAQDLPPGPNLPPAVYSFIKERKLYRA